MSSSLHLSDSITSIPLVGDSYAQKLTRLDINTVADLLHHYPARYIDRSLVTTIASLQDGEQVTIQAQVTDFKNIYTKFGKNLQQAVVTDATGKITITWFNQRFLEQSIRIGETYAFSGKVKSFHNHLSLSAPEHEHIPTHLETDTDQPNGVNIHTGRLVPVYPETAGVSSKWLRSRINHALKITTIQDHLPPSYPELYNLKPLTFALPQIHFPESKKSLELAQHRLAFDELFLLQLQGALKRHTWQQQHTPFQIHPKDTDIKSFIKSLPFELTAAQTSATKEILTDLALTQPMNRLLEGDVGSGKTVVAAIAIHATHLAGFKSILMAPTEILAQQHFQELQKLFNKTAIKVGLFTGSTKMEGDFDLTVGTHALLFQKLQTADLVDHNLGLIIIDEQHRFGVAQRAALETLGNYPHRLTMSATPIPRTVALTLYGDLDVSIIDQMPVNRKSVKTWVVPAAKRRSGYRWIDGQIAAGDQVFVVCPLIDPSESLKLSEVKSATEEFKKIKTAFPGRRIELLHGRLKSKEKDAIITSFKDHHIDILVSTPVIEVGIDVPNATIILIEAAERFGLAQLHQLRGRVGRGDKQSYCLLFTSTQTKTDSRRLSALTKYNSGFKLAEIDLKIRGPGQVFGVEQHGFADLKIAQISDKKLLLYTKQAAEDMINSDPNLSQEPLLKSKLNLINTPTITAN